jgi:3-oxoacyl-[acyl-carrier protein] reductase
MKKLEGKIALVTGASKGIGAATAKQLSAAGATVVVNYHTGREDADKVVSEIVELGGSAIALSADVSDENEIARLMARVKDAYGRIDILVNNAGVYAFGPIESFTAENITTSTT